MRFATAGDFLAELEAAEVHNQPVVSSLMAIPQVAGSEQAAAPRSSGNAAYR